MLRSAIVRLVELCTRYAWTVIVATVALSLLSAVYAVQHFAVKTDVNNLFPRDLPWTERAYSFMASFPQHGILVVVDAPTPELVDEAAGRLAAALKKDAEHIRAVDEPQGGAFFARNGLLFLPTEQVARVTMGMREASPMLGNLSADPSLRGALGALSHGLFGVLNGVYSLDALAPAMTMAADTVDAVLHGRPGNFSWRALAQGKAPDPNELRRFIQVEPILDFQALEPGRDATDSIMAAAQRLDLAGAYQARVRLTGLVPIDDAEFATLREHAAVNSTVSIIAVLVILWLALRSPRIIFATIVSIICGLAMTAALGLLLVGALNLISVAFFVLFVGLGIDFGIQYAVRYRAERHDIGALRPALVSAARKAGGPLALAAAATALGFSSFMPTAYRGLGELGAIAGPGMIIAFLVSVTLLPALLAVLNPPGEPHAMGFHGLAPIDRFLQRHRISVVAITLGVVVLASPLLLFLPFDFNPLHLQNPNSEAVATFIELRREPQTGANAIEIVAPDLAGADKTAKQVAALPQVAQAKTLSSLVPDDQEQKLGLIREAKPQVQGALDQRQTKPAPTDHENQQALVTTATSLMQVAPMSQGPGGQAANRLAGLLIDLAKASPEMRKRVEAAVTDPLRVSLAGLKEMLQAAPVTVASIPPDLKLSWVNPDGRARVQVLPKGDPEDTTVLRDFVRAVLDVEPVATGPAVLLYEAGNTIVHAFVEAGIFAVIAIALLLWLTLRRISDALLTLVPLLLATVVTLELCVVFDLPLNFANIIALPLLLGVGVAFKIYYIMAWRRGRTALVQSTLTRAVIFSAMTTATAFGSLWLSSHPGTSSMGKLMALALVCTMAAAVLFQPALMGPPRQATRDEGQEPTEPGDVWLVRPDREPTPAEEPYPVPVGSEIDQERMRHGR
jgi:uncharacterized protein